MTARVRYVAYLSEQPEALAAFYGERLQLDKLAQSAKGDISLTDGLFKLVIFRAREDLGEARNAVGPHHIGFAVDNLELAKARFRRLDPRCLMVPESGGQGGDIRFYDPEFLPVSLSQSGFGLPVPNGKAPKLRYLAIGSLDPETQANFYSRVFGLQPLDSGRSAGGGDRPDRLLTDGHIILAFYNYFGPNAGARPRYGLSRCGFASDGANRQEIADPDGNAVILAQSNGKGADAWRA